jgi:integrase
MKQYIDEFRNSLATQLATINLPIGSIPIDVLSNIELFPGFPASRLGRDEVTIPEHVLPAGPMRRHNDRTLKVTEVPWATDEQRASYLRSILALWRHSHATETGTREWKPTTWLISARLLLKTAKFLINAGHKNGKLWSSPTTEQLVAACRTVARNAKTQTQFEMVFRVLFDFGARGILSDAPTSIQLMPDDTLEPLEYCNGAEGDDFDARHPAKQFQPFPIPFIKLYGQRAFWIQANLSHDLLEWLRRDHELMKDIRRLYPGGAKDPRAIVKRRDLISKIEWRSADGTQITELPFEITQSEGSKSIRSRHWPPENPKTLTQMISTLQATNLNVVCMALGARHSELASATGSCLKYESADLVRYEAKHFKLAATIGGELRDWPLPPRAEKSLLIQKQIADILRPADTDHLWVIIQPRGVGNAGDPLHNLNEPTVRMCANLGIEDLLLGSRPHSHRWRETVGFLGAVCLVNAQQVLMDIFGHKNVEMTLHYMMSNPQVLRLIKETARAMNAALLNDVLIEAERKELGGIGGGYLNDGLSNWKRECTDSTGRYKYRFGRDVMDTSDRIEAFEVLTKGQYIFHQPMPNVLCIKQPAQHGLCSKSRGEPDPSRCSTKCWHRVERPNGRADCEIAIAQWLSDIQEANERGFVGAVAHFEGQLLAELFRFSDIRDRVIADSPVAARVWKERRIDV